jgi:hypothetical protein
MHDQRLGKSFTFPGGSFGSGVNTEEIFILCASNSVTDELRVRFEAKACVQTLRVASLCSRIQNELPKTATFRAERVKYYSPVNEPGAKWAFPDMIAFLKVDAYSWQDEFRFVFSLTDCAEIWEYSPAGDNSESTPRHGYPTTSARPTRLSHEGEGPQGHLQGA